MVDSSSQTLQNLPSDLKTNDNGSCTKTTYTASNSSMAINNHKSANVANCGVNRSEFKSRLEPSVPCYFLSSIITTLNAQITLLLVSLYYLMLSNCLMLSIYVSYITENLYWLKFIKTNIR